MDLHTQITMPIEAFLSATGLGRSKLYELIGDGDIASVLLGKRRLIVVRSYLELLDRKRAEQAAGIGRRRSPNPRARARTDEKRVAKNPRPAGWGPDRAGLRDCLAAESRPFLSQNPYLAQAARRLRRQRAVEALHALGGRATFEFVDEIIRHHPDIADDIDRRLSAYAGIDPGVLRQAGGDRFAPGPTRLVDGWRA